MLWVAAIVVLLSLGAVVVEHFVRERAVQEAADRIATAIDADVELHVAGRPLAWHLLRRHLPQVVVVATDLPVLEGRARLERLRVELDDVRLVGRGDDRHVVAGAGRFGLSLQGDQLLELVTIPTFLVSFTIIPEGLRLLTLAGVTVDAGVKLAGPALKVRARGSVLRWLPQPTFWLPLPDWPYGAVVERIALHQGWLEAWGTMAPDELVFPVRPPRRLRPSRTGAGPHDDGTRPGPS